MKSELSPVSGKHLIATIEGTTEGSRSSVDETSQSHEAGVKELTFDPADRFEAAAPGLTLARSTNLSDRGVPRLTKVLIWTGCAIAVLAIIGAAVFFFTRGHHASGAGAQTVAPPPVVTVTTTPSVVRSVDDNLTVTGSVAAWDPLRVGAEISGLRIVSVDAEEGDSVLRGAPLATLNSAVLRAQLRQAQARLQSSQAALKKSIQPNRPEEITGLRAALAHADATVNQEEAKRSQARVNLANAELNAQRYSELARMGATSSQEAENKHVAAATAKEEVTHCDARIKAAMYFAAQARERLLAAERGGRKEDVEVSQATLDEVRAQVAQLNEQIEQTVIRAPDNGVLTKREAHIGDISDSGKPLFHLIRQNKLELRANVSDVDLHKFKVGQQVKISSTEDGVRSVIGTVKLIIPQVDPSTRLGTVRIELPVNERWLHPGMFVRGTVNLGTREAVTVPAESLVTRNGENYVYTLGKENRAVSHSVAVGTRADKFVEISNGLAAGEPVIVQGARFLADNDVVRVASDRK